MLLYAGNSTAWCCLHPWCLHLLCMTAFCGVQIKARAVKLGLNCSFLGARDHMDDSIAGYRVFVNASTSDVVATTSAEALAMGKW